MKLHILSDVHLEFAPFEPPVTDADVVVLAGDIGVGRSGLDWAKQCFPGRPVVYVAGNHEFYGHDLDLMAALKAGAGPDVHVLENDSVEIDGVRFLGCVLWTDFALYGEAGRVPAMARASAGMNDFRLIRAGDGTFTPADALRLHEASRAWLEDRLAQPFDGSTVVVTHHAPSPRSVPQQYAGDSMTPAFASDLEHLMGADRVALWVHGHMHQPFDYEVGGTRVVCNPRGYMPDERMPEFAPGRIVTVG